MEPTTADHQLRALRLYGTLMEEREDWGGALVLGCGEGSASSGIPAAASIAGGTALIIDSDAAAVKLAMRRGELDFVVNTLDEALRTLKNQIRQRRPLSVGLIANVPAAMRELTERGVLPDLLLVGSSQPSQSILQNEDLAALQTMGMPLRVMRDPGECPGRAAMDPARQRWIERRILSGSSEELREIDRRLLTLVPIEDHVRRRWIERVSKYVRDARSGGRWIWLSEEERARMGGAIRISRE